MLHLIDKINPAQDVGLLQIERQLQIRFKISHKEQVFQQVMMISKYRLLDYG